MALRYVGRYATTCSRLGSYLRRKIAERGWEGDEAEPAITAIVDRFAEVGYVDDRSFAETRAAGLARRGYGPRRIDAAMRAAGINAAIADDVAPDDKSSFRAAEAFARRRRIGAFAEAVSDPALRQRQIGAMVRAGHDFATARRFVDAPPGRVPNLDD